MQYHYTAYTLDQGIIKGRVEAKDEAEVRSELIEQGYKLLEVKPRRHLPSIEKILPSLFQIKTGQLIAFARQASTLLASGADLLRVLEMLQAEASNRRMRNIIGSIHEKVSQGESFTRALREHPDVFDEVFVSLAEVGEYTGRLGPALEQLADIMAQAHEAKQRAIKTLMMPLFLVGSSVLMLGFMAFVAFPPLLDTFQSMDVEIPLVTTLLIGSVKGVVTNALPIFLGGVAAFALYKVLQRFSPTKYGLDKVKCRAPLLGPLVMASELGRFARIMATLLTAGVDLPTSLRLGLGSSQNEVLRRAWTAADQSLVAGHRMGEALSKHRIVPNMFVEMVAIGEESNSLPRTMTEVADSYQKQFEDRIGAILAIVEPTSQIAVGGVVLIMMLSIIKPILSAANAL